MSNSCLAPCVLSRPIHPPVCPSVCVRPQPQSRLPPTPPRACSRPRTALLLAPGADSRGPAARFAEEARDPQRGRGAGQPRGGPGRDAGSMPGAWALPGFRLPPLSSFPPPRCQASCSASRSPPPSSPSATTGAASSPPPSAPSSSVSWLSGSRTKVPPVGREAEGHWRPPPGPADPRRAPRDHHSALQNPIPPRLPLRPAGAARLRCHRVSVAAPSHVPVPTSPGWQRDTGAHPRLTPGSPPGSPAASGARSSSTSTARSCSSCAARRPSTAS